MTGQRDARFRGREVSALETLEPKSPADRRALYQLVRDQLAQRMLGQQEAVDRMALTTVRYLAGEGGRVFLRGPTGSGKTTLIRRLAEMLDVPFVEIDASQLAETNWKGVDLSNHLEHLRRTLERRYPLAIVPLLATRACVLVDNIDGVRLASRYASASTQDYRLGQQKSLVPLVGNGVVPVPYLDSGWRSDEALVVVAGRLDGLTTDHPTVEDLVAWGFTEPLARNLAAASRITLGALSPAQVSEIIRRGGRMAIESARAFGANIVLSDEVVAFLTEAVLDGRVPGGAVVAGTVIQDAIERAVMRMLKGSETKLAGPTILAPDDVALPSSNERGIWRE